MRSNHLPSMMLGAALFTLACAPIAWAAGSSMTSRGNFIIFRGFPPFTQDSRFMRFTPSPQATAFPLGLCCVTGATPPEARVIVVENPPVPESKPTPPKEASVETVLGVTVMRGVATYH
jgi:hypothetical protein